MRARTLKDRVAIFDASGNKTRETLPPFSEFTYISRIWGIPGWLVISNNKMVKVNRYIELLPNTTPEPTPPPVPIPPTGSVKAIHNPFLIVKHLPGKISIPGAEWEVNAVAVNSQMIPIKRGKGQSYPFYLEMERLVFRLNKKHAAELIMDPHQLLFNKGSARWPETDGSYSSENPVTENIFGFGNMYQYTHVSKTRTGTWYRIKTTKYNASIAGWDVRTRNWFTDPCDVWKESTRDELGNIGLPGKGDHCYIPTLGRDYSWLHESFVEVAPQLGFEIDGEIALQYGLLGASVVVKTETRDIPVRIAKPNQLIVHPFENIWKMNVGSVVVEDRPDWVYPF